MFVLNQQQKDIIKKYSICYGIRVFYLIYKNIFFKDLLLFIGNEIIIAKFKSEDIFLKS